MKCYKVYGLLFGCMYVCLMAWLWFKMFLNITYHKVDACFQYLNINWWWYLVYLFSLFMDKLYWIGFHSNTIFFLMDLSNQLLQFMIDEDNFWDDVLTTLLSTRIIRMEDYHIRFKIPYQIVHFQVTIWLQTFWVAILKGVITIFEWRIQCSYS